MGKELHIPTPYNEYTYHMIKALEEKNDGLFDYDQENQRNEHRKEAYKMEKIIDRENKEAVKALKKDNFYFGYMAARKLERADYVETISGLRKPEAKKIKAAV